MFRISLILHMIYFTSLFLDNMKFLVGGILFCVTRKRTRVNNENTTFSVNFLVIHKRNNGGGGGYTNTVLLQNNVLSKNPNLPENPLFYL